MTIHADKYSVSGFSLIEVIVALAVAATMVISYISLAEKSLFMVQSSRSIWENINFGQEFLGQNTFNEIDDLSAMFVRWKDREEKAYWRLTREKLSVWDDLPPDFGSIVKNRDDLPDIYQYTLETQLEDSQISWVWYLK